MGTDTCRVAIISTPRSGNCWLRQMLADLLGLEEIRAKRPADVNWNDLPDRAVLLLHWWLEDQDFVARLREHGFRVVVLSRHPLDVLISILVYSQHDHSTLQWLDGAAGNERGILGASPFGEAFLSYATGPRAKELLGVSAAWWQAPQACRVRYEDLVADTAVQLQRILADFGETAAKPVADVVKQAAPEEIRDRSLYWRYHVWQARPGLWRKLLTPPVARRICEAHPIVMERFGYVCDHDESLSEADAQAAWDQLDSAALKRNVHGVKAAFYELDASLRRDLESQRQETWRLGASLAEVGRHREDLERHRVELERQHVQSELLRVKLDNLACRFAELPWDHLRDISQLGRRSVIVARALQRCSQGVRRLSVGIRSLVSMGDRATRPSGRGPAAQPPRTVQTIDIGLVSESQCDARFPWREPTAQAILSN